MNIILPWSKPWEIKMDRFKMEDMIMSCWGAKDDMELLSERIMEDDISTDSIINALIGMAEIHEMKCKKLFEIFECMIRTGEISSPTDFCVDAKAEFGVYKKTSRKS